MPLVVPLSAVPDQTITVLLNNQSCRMRCYQLITGLYMDLYVSDVLIIGGVICQNLNRIVRDVYLGFSGDLAFVDQQGTSDPTYSELTSRYTLMYFDPSDLAGMGL